MAARPRLRPADPARSIRGLAPEGVDRIIEVAFSENIDLDAAVAKNNTVIAAYATREDRPDFPFWPMLFDNITIRLLGSDDFPAARNSRRRPTSPPRPGRASSPSLSANHSTSRMQRRLTTASTGEPANVSCSRIPS